MIREICQDEISVISGGENPGKLTCDCSNNPYLQAVGDFFAVGGAFAALISVMLTGTDIFKNNIRRRIFTTCVFSFIGGGTVAYVELYSLHKK